MSGPTVSALLRVRRPVQNDNSELAFYRLPINGSFLVIVLISDLGDIRICSQISAFRGDIRRK